MRNLILVATLFGGVSCAIADGVVLSAGRLKVTLEEGMPVASSVEFAGKTYEQPKGAARFLVNGEAVNASGSGKSVSETEAMYRMTLGKLACVYRVTVAEDTIAWELVSVNGGSRNDALHIKMEPALFTLPGGTLTLGAQVDGASTYAFLNKDEICAAAYQVEAWWRPFREAEGALADPGFHWRLTQGTRPSKDGAKGKEAPLPCVTKVHFSGDVNGDGAVDWQDGALWVRKEIPQVPSAVRAFFNGGLWMQTHGAFPGNGNGAPPSQYDALTTVYSLPDQLLEVQRQIYAMTDHLGQMSYEYVGWNGHGHDYGWPSINEIPFNPALGKDADHRRVQKEMKKVGGDFSFHVNMTDITDNSAAWRRGSAKSPYGNRSISTGQGSYGANVFGWNAYFICHYRDYKNAFNRQAAFFKRFGAPRFMYQDVMLDKPANGVRPVDEQYAKMREVMRWKTLGGTHLASEYYYPEKRTGGLLLMKNNVSPNTVDQFICAGQTFMHYTRSRATRAADYIWASLYSDNQRTGDFSVSGLGTKGSRNQVELVFLLSYPNGYCASKGLVRAVGDTTYWGKDVTYSAQGNALTMREAGRDILRVQFDGGIHGDALIPGYTPGAADYYAYSTRGGTITWQLPDKHSTTTFLLDRLTSEGPRRIGPVQARGSTLTLTLEPGFAYSLRAKATSPSPIAENVARTADVSASSTTGRARLFVAAPEAKKMPTIPANSQKGAQVAYYISTTAPMAFDGVARTYWEPEATDANPSLTMTFAGERTLAELEVKYAGKGDDSVTVTDEAGKAVASGAASKLAFAEPVKTRKLTFAFSTPAEKLRVSEINVFTTKE